MDQKPGLPCLILYECGICDCLHPWKWDGDCRENGMRFSDPAEYAAELGVDEDLIEVRYDPR